MFNTLEEYAEHVRRETGRLQSRLAFGHHDEAAEIAATLCQQSAAIVQQRAMEAEASAPDRYDLAALPAPSGSPFDGD